MGEKVTYYSFAENDYWFLKANVEEKRVSNAMCATAQNICEKYLKEIIKDVANVTGDTDIMKTHSLKRLKRFIEVHVPEFECNWSIVVPADGYYFSARYPGEDSYFVNEEDVEECWRAVQETKRATDSYLERVNEKIRTESETLDLERHKRTLKQRMKR